MDTGKQLVFWYISAVILRISSISRWAAKPLVRISSYG